MVYNPNNNVENVVVTYYLDRVHLDERRDHSRSTPPTSTSAELRSEDLKSADHLHAHIAGVTHP